MAVSVQMPALGESVTEGTVTRWLKQEGDPVAVDEPLLEVSTDKVDTQDPRRRWRRPDQIVAAEDDVVEVGGELAVIGEAGEAPRPRPRRTAAAPAPAAAPEPAPAAAPAAPAAARLLAVGRHRRRRGVDRDARARRVGHRGHGDPLAEEGRRPGRGRRPAGQVSTDKVDTEDPVAGRRRAVVDHRRGRRRRPGRRRARRGRCRRRRARSGSRRTRARSGSGSEPKPEPAPEPKPAPAAAAPAAPAPGRGRASAGDDGPYVTPLVCASWPPSTTSTCPPSPAPVSAGTSASRMCWPPPRTKPAAARLHRPRDRGARRCRTDPVGTRGLLGPAGPPARHHPEGQPDRQLTAKKTTCRPPRS